MQVPRAPVSAQDRIRQALLRWPRGRALLAILYINVDKFKAVIDTLVHAAGDALPKS